MSELNVAVEELSPVVRRLQIDVPADRVSKVTDSVYVRLSHTVKLKGYRAGHVPRRIIEKHFSDQVRSEVAREVMKSTFSEALRSANLSPVSEPTIEPQALTLGQSYHYAARVEVRPEVKLQQYKGLEIFIHEAPVADSAVEARIEELRQRQSNLTPIEGRDEAQLGDYAVVNQELSIDGDSRPAEKTEGGLVELRPGTYLDGHGEKLVGQKIGETREIAETFSAEQSDKLAGKVARFKVTLTGLKRSDLPALDDEFAKDARGLSTMAELRAEIRKELETQANEALITQKRSAITEALIAKNPIEAPPALVDATATRMAYDLLQRLMQFGYGGEGNEALINRVKQDAIPRATNDVKSMFLFEAIAKEENITIGPKDLEKKLADIAEQTKQPIAKVSARYQSPDGLQTLALQIRHDRVVELLLASAQVTVKPPEAPEAEEAPAQESGANG